MKDKSLVDFLTELGAKTAIPGGGAVAGLNGAIAASQLKMVCEYTADKKIRENTGVLEDRSKTFLELSEADMAAFSKVTAAYEAKDKPEIYEALSEALSPSRKIISFCEELISFCEINHAELNPRLKADLIVSLANLKAAVRSACAMIATNLEALESDHKDMKENSDYCYELLGRVDKLYKKLGV